MDPNFNPNNPNFNMSEWFAWMSANAGNFNPSMRPGNVARNLFPNPPQVHQSQFFSSPISQPHGMYSQDDVEYVAETQPESMPKTTARRRRPGKEAVTGSAPARNVPWSEDEDLVLLRCYFDVCTDSTTGTNQKYATLFKRVHEQYENARLDNMYTGLNDRTTDSLRKRVQRIKAEMNNWLVCYETATKAVGQRSGHNEDDVIRSAQELHKQNKNYRNGFSLFKQWSLMKDYPEYETYLNWETTLRKNDRQTVGLDDAGSAQRESTGGSSGTKRFRLVDDSVSSPQRPMGRDKAKRIGKSSSSVNSDMEVISQGWSDFNANYSKQIEIERRRMEMQVAKEAKKSEDNALKEARKLEQIALKKVDQKIRMREQLFDLWKNYHNLNPQQKAYAEKLHAELESED